MRIRQAIIIPAILALGAAGSILADSAVTRGVALVRCLAARQCINKTSHLSPSLR